MTECRLDATCTILHADLAMKSSRPFRPKSTPRTATEDETTVRDDYRAILQQVAQIPSGQVATYGQIAWLAGLPGRARLVGRVLASLPPQFIEDVPDQATTAPPSASPAVCGPARVNTANSARKDAESCPWHRVINAQGKLSLPINSAAYLEQRRRLRGEGVLFRKQRIDLRRYQWRTLNESPLRD